MRLEGEPDASLPAPLRHPKIIGTAVTAFDGSFAVLGVEPGTHALLLADAQEQPVAVLGSRAITVEPIAVETIDGRDVSDLELRVELPQGRIEGVVQGPDGEPIADAWVVATAEGDQHALWPQPRRATTLTLADGRFVLEGPASTGWR